MIIMLLVSLLYLKLGDVYSANKELENSQPAKAGSEPEGIYYFNESDPIGPRRSFH